MVVEVKRQAILEIHQAITAAEVRANELVSQERVRMENVLNHIKKTAKDEAVKGLNKQSDSAEVSSYHFCHSMFGVTGIIFLWHTLINDPLYDDDN